VTKAGKTITAADIKAGDAVQVRYIEEGGKSTAQTVAVRPPAPAKKAEAKAAEKKP
jgi:hypothetical protein